MSKRIVIVTLERKFDSDEAIQPRHDDPLFELVRTATDKASCSLPAGSDHRRVVVANASSTKEVDERVRSEVELPEVGHQVVILIVNKALTVNTANKEVAGGNEEKQPQKSGYRLEKLKQLFFRKMIQLLDKSIQGAFEEFGKELGKRGADALCSIAKWSSLIYLLHQTGLVKTLLQMLVVSVTK